MVQGVRLAHAATQDTELIALPPPVTASLMPFERTLLVRRSVREFQRDTVGVRELGQLMWAAQGVTGPEGLRAVPSAGSLYPLELYAATRVGLYHYHAEDHALAYLSERDLRPALYRSALGQDPVVDAPVVFVIAAAYERVERTYGHARGPRYVHMEAGHAAQNLLLQAVALGLGGVPIAAFEDEQVQKALGLPDDHAPLYLIPVGRPR